MNLPKWNPEWEKPDPLRGRLGWAKHHRYGVVVVFFLVAFVFGWLVTAVWKSHRTAAALKRQMRERSVVLELDSIEALLDEFARVYLDDLPEFPPT